LGCYFKYWDAFYRRSFFFILLGKIPEEEILIRLGSKSGTGKKESTSISFGNCSPVSAKKELRVKGCPPYPFELKKILEENGIL